METEKTEIKCFSKSFSESIQLFQILTKILDFSQPFRVAINYDPKGLRTTVEYEMPKESLARYNEKELGICLSHQVHPNNSHKDRQE